ncbi:MAG: imidazole glycerol phosphate synthase subunit HisH [Gammaproteobacteria bacterium]|nr:MAG: imidazole glycerol phosphate synthase subunit HisH [Gammaproteobacteria bacterium]
MRREVTIVDHGLGNLYSVSRAVEVSGGVPLLSGDPDEVRRASRLVLPGVGAFADGMAGLRERGLDQALREAVAAGTPLLAICLGMQMLADASEEFGEHTGLGLVPGRVAPIPATGTDGRPHRIPHTGWTRLHLPPGRSGWEGTVLEGSQEGTWVYLVHSFHLQPDRAEDRLADCDYDGVTICAAVTRGAVTGLQFHPEKSGPAGLHMLERFLQY